MSLELVLLSFQTGLGTSSDTALWCFYWASLRYLDCFFHQDLRGKTE